MALDSPAAAKEGKAYLEEVGSFGRLSYSKDQSVAVLLEAEGKGGGEEVEARSMGLRAITQPFKNQEQPTLG